MRAVQHVFRKLKRFLTQPAATKQRYCLCRHSSQEKYGQVGSIPYHHFDFSPNTLWQRPVGYMIFRNLINISSACSLSAALIVFKFYSHKELALISNLFSNLSLGIMITRRYAMGCGACALAAIGSGLQCLSTSHL